MIEAKAEFWKGRITPEKIDVKIEKTGDEIKVNGKVATVEFNGIQLMLKVKDGTYRLIDGRTGSKLTIAEMYQQLR